MNALMMAGGSMHSRTCTTPGTWSAWHGEGTLSHRQAVLEQRPCLCTCTGHRNQGASGGKVAGHVQHPTHSTYDQLSQAAAGTVPGSAATAAALAAPCLARPLPTTHAG